MELEELENKIIDICTDLGNTLYYDKGQMDINDWNTAYIDLSSLASYVAKCANRLASYAGIAAKKAQKGY